MQDLRNIARIFTAPLYFINKYFKALLFLFVVLLVIFVGAMRARITTAKCGKTSSNNANL